MARLRGGAAVALLLLCIGSVGASTLEAQDRLQQPLRPMPATDLPVTPLLEGWYENEDGTYAISFGYFNRNENDTIRIAPGEDNDLVPPELAGVQPSVFLPGRHHGVFAVTLPAERRNEDVWWSIRNLGGEVHEVPGRAQAHAYQLDWFPRPHGSVVPLAWFESEEKVGRGPVGVIAEGVRSVPVGSPITLSIHVRDPSDRDPDDHRLQDGVPVRVTWYEHSGPGPVQFIRHESTPALAEEPNGEGEPAASEIVLPEGEGTAMVVAIFSEPGEYVLRARVDNFDAPDSSSGNQCCWTNGYVRVSVTP